MKIQPKQMIKTDKFGVTLYPFKSYNAEFHNSNPKLIRINFSNVVSVVVPMDDVTIIDEQIIK